MSALTFLGLALKAGKLEIGEETCGIAARAKKAKLIITASDASQNSRTRAGNYCQDCKAPHMILPYTKAEIGAVVGRGTPGMLAITDTGMAAAFASKMAAEDPEKFGEMALELQKSAQRVLQRRREAEKHIKNIKTGKKKK